jgi:TP901 family phage tail tape measure protein
VYNEDVSIDFSANIAPFSASLTQAVKQLETFGASADTATGRVGKLNTATLSVVKVLGKFVDLNKTSTAAAAAYQQKLSGLATVTALNEKQFKGLSDVALKFGREFPIGLTKSVDLVKTLQSSGVNTTKSINELGNAFIKIQAATGEFGGQFVADMLSVNRSFGSSMSSVGKFGDSLVTVSNKFGASASSVIGFTKALAPFSSAMGINQTSTMGLSTAFSRLGEDGTRSANALNKVMSDLTKSVKTGSPEVRQYASVMSMTTETLTQLVNTDPAEAVIRFTEAINKQGPKAMNTLNQLGFDGIQTFKSLQALGKSTDLRDILKTSREAYGSGSAQEGAQVALGGVNDQMTRLGESMQQTIAVAGTPFLELIEKLLSGMNSVAETVNKITTALSKAAQAFAPLLAAVNVLKSAFAAIAAIQFARFIGNAFQNNTQLGRSLAAGRADASYGITQPGGNAMYRLGTAIDNNMSGIMARPLRETAGMAYQGVKGALGYGMAGYMNMTSNFLRSDPSEASRSQLATRNFSENLQGLKRGDSVLTASQRVQQEKTDAIRAKQGLNPLDRGKTPDGPMGNMKAMGEAFKQFGKDLQTSGTSAKTAGAVQMTAAREVGAAFKGLALMTMKATVEVVKLGVAALASAAMSAVKQIGMMALVSGVIAAFTSIKGGIDKSNKIYKEAMSADLGSSYNDFAEKAGLATVSINNLASAARDAARALVMNNKTLDEANQITKEEIGASRNPGYESAKDFGKGRSVEDLTNAVLNLQGNSPDAQARAQLLMDISNQYGGGTAMQVAGNLSGQKGLGTTEQQATDQDVYSAGLQDYTRNKDNRWWGGRTENEASKDSLISLRTNLAQNVNNVSSVYGQKAGSAASVIESEKLIKAALDSGSSEQFRAARDAVNEQLGVNLTAGMFEFKNQSLTQLLGGTLGAYGDSDEMKAERLNRQSVLDSIQGVNLNGANYASLYNANDKPQNVKSMEEADAAFKKINKSAMGLTNTFFEATQIALDSGANLGDISQGGKRSDIYQNLSKTQQASVDLANKPNDPVALNTKATQLLTEALKQNGGDITAAVGQLALASKSAASGTTEKSMALAAYGKAQAQQNIADAGASFTTRSMRDIAVGQKAQAGGVPIDPEDRAIYDEQISAMQQAQAQQLGMVKQFAEARANLDTQMLYQQQDYQKTVIRSNRDFNLQLSYQDADYRKGVRRANEDFKLQRTRQSEDFAKSVFSPFQRVAAVRTTDASSLVGNLKNQNKIIKEQMANLTKLKKLGLTQQSIDTLDLMNPANAQEVARLLRDMTANKSLLDATNAEVKTRNELASKYVNSSMNQASNRSTADFSKNMKRGEEDYTTAVDRAVKAHRVALSDMAKDLKTTRIRAFEELARFGREIDVTAGNAKNVLEGAFKGMPDAAKTQMSKALVNLKSVMNNFNPTPIEVPVTVAAPTFTAPSQATRAAAAEQNIQLQRESMVTAVEGSTGTTADGSFAYYSGGKWRKFNPKAFDPTGPGNMALLANLMSGKANPANVNTGFFTVLSGKPKIKNMGDDYYQFAEGGMVRGPGSGKSDSINARLSNGEYVVKADAVRKYGESFLDNVNAQKLAHASYVHGADSKMSSMQGYASNITNNNSTQFDQSTQIHGPITVQSTDPNQFMRQMQAKKRFARLTQPAGN